MRLIHLPKTIWLWKADAIQTPSFVEGAFQTSFMETSPISWSVWVFEKGIELARCGCARVPFPQHQRTKTVLDGAGAATPASGRGSSACIIANSRGSSNCFIHFRRKILKIYHAFQMTRTYFSSAVIVKRCEGWRLPALAATHSASEIRGVRASARG
jgi:hypothetical protein